MVRVAAWRIIAAVQYTQSVGDWPIAEHPAKAMGKPVAKQGSKIPISKVALRSSPNPTRTSLIDVPPEPLLDWSSEVNCLVAARPDFTFRGIGSREVVASTPH